MKIYFNSPPAWKFLSELGFVFTLRKCHTRRLPARFLEVSIIHDGKLVAKGKKLWVTTVVSNPVELKSYFRYSGFATAKEWLDEARKLSGTADFWDLYLVFITTVSKLGQESKVSVVNNSMSYTCLAPVGKNLVSMRATSTAVPKKGAFPSE